MIEENKLNISIAGCNTHEGMAHDGSQYMQRHGLRKCMTSEPHSKKIFEKLNWNIPLEKEIKDLSDGQKGPYLLPSH